jgi:glycosyltransferase involved in cell wall biosynthesis
LRRQLARDNGFELSRMTSVRTGIDLVRFRAMDQAACRRALGVDARPALGIVATLRDWKGHDYLLDAWTRLRSAFPQWQLLVIGDGPQRARLEARTADEGLADSVRFVGNQDDVPKWLNSLDLFVLPSFGDEGVPQGIMQAMACGLAVVSTPVGAIEEAVQRGRTGLLVPPRDAAALAEALASLMGDAVGRRAFGEAGHAYAQAHFGVDMMLDKMEAVFRGAIHG